MDQLSLTLIYAPALALMFCVLSLLVVVQRRRTNTPYGDGDSSVLRGAIRAHGNFAEHVPIAIVLLALLEFTGIGKLALNGLFSLLILARISHATAMFLPLGSRLYFVTRVFGALSTWLVIVVSSVSVLSRAI